MKASTTAAAAATAKEERKTADVIAADVTVADVTVADVTAAVDAETQADLGGESWKSRSNLIGASLGLGYVDPTPIAPLIVDPG